MTWLSLGAPVDNRDAPAEEAGHSHERLGIVPSSEYEESGSGKCQCQRPVIRSSIPANTLLFRSEGS